MVDEFFVWSTMHRENSASLERPEGVKRFWDLFEGVPLAEGWGEVTCDMDANNPYDMGLLDVVDNFSTLAIISPQLRDFMRSVPCVGVEYLPINIKDHRGKISSREYSIINPHPLRHALDVSASGARYCSFDKTVIDDVDKLIINSDRVPSEVSIFRLSGLVRPVVVRKKLAELISGAGFLGIRWVPASAYPEM